MKLSLQHGNTGARKGTKRTLHDRTSLNICDGGKGRKKHRRSKVDDENSKDVKSTDFSEVLSIGGNTSFRERLNTTQHFPCDREKIISNGHLFSEEYVKDIAKAQAQNEEKSAELFPDPYYFPNQSDIRPRMRTILFAWVTKIHLEHTLRDDTLWAAFQICDRYLSKVDSHRKELQLLGCTALWIASKYHEIYPPLADDLVLISGNAFTKSGLIIMEARICKVLDFEFTIPNAFQYLNRYTDIALDYINDSKAKNRVKWLARYGMERFHLHLQAMQYCPSLLAAGALFAALKLTSNNWSKDCELSSGYGKDCFLFSGNKHKPSLFELYKKSIMNYDSDLHQAVVDKYKSSERGSVSTLRKKEKSNTR